MHVENWSRMSNVQRHAHRYPVIVLCNSVRKVDSNLTVTALLLTTVEM